MPYGVAAAPLNIYLYLDFWFLISDTIVHDFFKVDAIPNPSKEQLIDVVQRHFMSQVLAILLAFFFLHMIN